MKALFLVGPHACGKTYSTKLALNNPELKDIVLIDTGPVIREIHKREAPDMKIGAWVEQLETLYGENITDDLISAEVARRIEGKEKVIIIGNRTIEGINYMINKIGIEHYQVLYIDLPFELLYQNYLTRTKKDISILEFKDFILAEYNSGLATLKQACLSGAPEYDYFSKEKNEDSLEPRLLDYFGKHQVLSKNIEGDKLE